MEDDTLKSQVLEKGLWKLLRPSLMETVLGFTLPVINTFFLSRISDAAAGAAGIVAPFIIFPMLLYGCVAAGGTSVVGRCFGADNYAAGKAALAALFSMMVALGLIVMSVFHFGAPYINHLMGLPAGVKEHADIYLTTVSLVFLPLAFNAFFKTVLRLYGQIGLSLIVTIVMYLVTISLNSIVVFELFGVPPLGVAGVAGSLVTSTCISVIFLLLIVHWKLRIKLPYKDGVKHLKTYCRSILNIAVPSSFEPLVAHLTTGVIVNAMVAKLGADMIAAKVYVEGVFVIALIVNTAFAQVTHLMITQLLGQRDYNGVHAQLLHSTRIALTGVAGVCLVLLLANQPIIQIFTDNPAIMEIAFVLFLVAAVIELPKTVNMMVSGSLRMAGDAWFVAHNVMAATWFVMIPAAYLFVFIFDWGLVGVFVAALLDELIRLVANWWRWGRRKWIEYAVSL